LGYDIVGHNIVALIKHRDSKHYTIGHLNRPFCYSVLVLFGVSYISRVSSIVVKGLGGGGGGLQMEQLMASWMHMNLQQAHTVATTTRNEKKK